MLKIAKVSALMLGVVTVSYFSDLWNNQPLLQLQSAQASPKNECGPNNSQALNNATKFFLFPYNKTFNPACIKHDACYSNLRTSGKTKEQCEKEFRRNLYKTCESRSLWKKLSQDVFGIVTNPKLWGGIGVTGPCKRQADYAYWAVSQFGESALGNSAIHSLKVVNVKAKRIYDRWSDDELQVCVTVRNDGNLATEWDLVLLNKTGGIADTEPNTYERNIRVGQTDTECVGTRGTRFSISDLGSKAKVAVRFDDVPGIAPLTPIADIRVATNRRKGQFTKVPYNHMSKMEAFRQIKQAKQQR